MGQSSYSTSLGVRRSLPGLIFLVFVLLAGTAFAQQSLEIIPLQHRSVEQVLPSLQPLLEPGATLSGMNNQLFLRASAKNRAEIKQVLAVIDVPLRRLVIRVTTDSNDVNSSRGAQVAISSRNGNNQVTTRIHDTRDNRSGNHMQMVQTVDGGRAFIQTGVSVAIPFQKVIVGQGGSSVGVQGVEYRDIGRGFFAEPRLTGGEMVTVEITQQADTPANLGPGSANFQRLSTSVSGRLGEWMQLGGIGQSADNRSRENISLSTNSARSDRGVWLMVEEAR
ncbi:MAG: secretin N-terminal domain-containing protein [Azovibrio sp.]